MKLNKIIIALLIVCLLFAGCKPKKVDQPEGSGETIEPSGDVTTLDDKNYSYDEFLSDAQTLTEKHASQVEMGVFGKSTFNRELIYFSIGDKNAEDKVLVVSGISGTEGALSLLTIKQIETYLEDLTRKYKDVTYQQILNKCCIYFVPMLNPDGIELAAKGIDSVPEAYKQTVEEIYSYSLDAKLLDKKNGYKQWCANGIGIDLSMNFGVGKVAVSSVQARSASKGYPQFALSSLEAGAIAGLIQNNNFDSVVVYNGSGNIVDWQFGQSAESLQQSLDTANALAYLTGFSRIDIGGPTKNNFITMGIKDWFIANFDKPAFTLFMGNPSDKISLNQDEIKALWNVTSLVPISLAWNIAYYTEQPISTPDPTKTETPGKTEEPTQAPTQAPGVTRTPQVDYDYID